MYRRRTSLVGLGIVLVAGACADATGPAEHLEVTITASSAIATAERPVIIRVGATNAGDEPLVVRTNSCPEAYRVTTRRGKPVGPGPSVCPLILITEVVEPGERLEFSYSWAGTTRLQAGGPMVQLPPARYNLRGVVFAEGEEITSPVIAIEVQQ